MDDLDLGATIKGFNPGQRIFNRYTLKKILGRGGMGVVWLARDGDLDREVAMKFLPEIVSLDPEAVADLKRETRRNLELTHPHIVRIYDFVSDGRTAAITMEFIDGATLSALKLEKPGRIFSVAELTTWVGQLCAALTYAHTEAQVVHRDLKPANLMIDARGRLKITDFGIARGISDSVSRVSAQAGGSSGTPLYMSPQQMMGEKPSVADDIYSLGATLYELLTGKVPFHSGNVLLQVQSKTAPTIAVRRREFEVSGEAVPAAWEEAIAACLAKEASARPKSVEELWNRLSGKTTLLVMPARAATVVPPAVPPPAKSKAPLIAALAGAVILLGAAGWYFGAYVPEQTRQAEMKRLQEEGRAAEAAQLRNEKEKIDAAAKDKLERERAMAAQLAAARGGIIVRSNPPGAEITVGALDHGTAPLTLKEVKLGKYPAKARLPGYEDWIGEIEVKENEFTEISAELVRWSGRLAVSSAADGVEVGLRALDGNGPAQTVRLPATLTLPVGRYELVFRRSGGWLDLTRQVEIERNKQTTLAESYAAARRSPDWYGRASASELRSAAEAGDLEARVRLGDHFFLGLDGPVDVNRAYEQYQVAFAAKYPPVYRRLNLLYTVYLVGPFPFEQTERLLREGALAGDPMAIAAWQQRALRPAGLKETTPAFSEAELTKAVQKIEELARQGDVFAMELVGNIYALGAGVAKDEAVARRWRKEGAERGSVRCMSAYASMLLTEKNPSEALLWLNKAAERGGDLALNRLAQMYRTGEQVTADKAKAVQLLLQAANHGYYPVMGSLATAYQQGDGVAADPGEAFRWRQKAAESGSPFYMNALADAYLNGTGTAKDPARAIQLYKRSAEWNDAAACYKLGSLYSEGLAVIKDENQAVAWFRKGAKVNDTRSQEELKKRNLTW